MSDPGMLAAVLREAAGIMLAVSAGRATLDDALDRADAGRRRILEHLLLNFYRLRKSLTAHWRRFTTRPPAPELAALLDAATAQIECQDRVAPQSVVNVAVTLAKPLHADRFVNAVLRRAAAAEWRRPETPETILPDPVLARWKREFSAETVTQLARTLVTPADFTFRLCGDTPVPGGCAALPDVGPFRFASGAAGKILDSAGFAAGKYYIQDPAAALAVALAAPQVPGCRRILDLCAAPGGKSLMLAELLAPGAELTAADRSARRQELTAENFRRHGIKARVLTAEPAELEGEYDLVLADVPCSNTGVFRRRPDALWRFDESALSEIMALQKQIVAQAVRLTAPGGTLILSSCSIETDENRALIAAAGCEEAATCETWLPDRTHDGAFAAVCCRAARRRA